MKIICTTSDNYSHLIPVFCYLFNKNWWSEQPVEIVGYEAPKFQLPSNFTFHSLGTQTDNKKDFSNDLIKYFEKQSDYFIWLMEDSFIKIVDFSLLNLSKQFTVMFDNVGRVNLTTETLKQDHQFLVDLGSYRVFENTQTAKYRLSTQPSIWNREFLLKYLTADLSPWEFETQESINDGYRVVGLNRSSVMHNEGVRKHDIYKFDLEGISQNQINEMKKLKIIK